MTKKQLWDTLTWALEYAASTEKDVSTTNYVQYIEEIGRTARQLCTSELSTGINFTDSQIGPSTWKRKGISELDDSDQEEPVFSKQRPTPRTASHWTATVPWRRSRTNTTFTSVAIWRGLTSYIEAKLASNSLEKSAYPLLLSAVADYNFCRQLRYHDRPHIAHSGPNVEIIQLLFKYGAYPNELVPQLRRGIGGNPRTVWKVVQKKVQKHPADESEAWNRIHEIFLSHGASDDGQKPGTQIENDKSRNKRTGKLEKWKVDWGFLKKAI